uniref:Coiled-coil domain-containing protein 93 n=1 Tax=Macrostomum lignano TaxID=282301 RepID=A0A1I8IQU3_9PLAT
PGMAHRYREGEYDIRKDEDQEAKEAECLQLLVSAGYFRARIRGLSAFDKLVGGLCWCVQGCSVDIDADLLFHEGSSIGQKIALTEKIVRALRRMRCPHAIEPHQIQGRDFVHVFPVVQWLVTQVIGRRDQMTADWRQFAVEQYRLLQPSAAHQPASQPELAAAAAALADRRAQLKAAFPTQRRLRKPAAYRGAQVPEETQVRTTLLEYNGGLGTGVTGAGTGAAGATGAGGAGSGAAGGAVAASAASELAEMGEAGQQKRLAASLVAPSSACSRPTFNEPCWTSGQQAEQAAERERAARERRDVEVARVAAAEQQRADFAAQLSALGAVAQDPRAAARLDRLVAAAEELRQREAEQKATLRAEAAELEAELARLRDRAAAAGDVEAEAANSERVAKATEQAAAAAERLAAARAQLAEASRACASLRRRIDEFPSQTKQFYCLYNSACSLRELLEREIQLLTSVEDNYRQTERSPAGRQELAGQLEKIVESARQNQSQAERRLTTEKAKRDGLNSEYLRLVESERRYNKLVKDFRAEAAKNERLSCEA